MPLTIVFAPVDGASAEMKATSKVLAAGVDAGVMIVRFGVPAFLFARTGMAGPAVPSETTSVTELPCGAVPLAGVWLMTLPDATVSLLAVVTAPTFRPALVIAVVAAACVRPTTFGTAMSGGPDDTTRFTAVPALTPVPAAGSWLMTRPAGTVVLVWLVTVPTI